MMLEIELSEDIAQILSHVMNYDKKENRARIDIKALGDKLNIDITAKDKTALRSAFNTNVRLINSCLKCLKIR